MTRPRQGAESDRKDAALIAAPPDALLDTPLGYLLAEHVRHRGVCGALRRLASDDEFDRTLAGQVSAFLASDLALHHRDEDEDLFPLLSRRSLPEDGLGEILAQLTEEHRRIETQARRIVSALTAAGAGGASRMTQRAINLMLEYGSSEQRHLAVENGIVLVIARKRLKSGDLEVMTRSMKARRGIAT